jgi:hypothetical protein
MHPTRAALRAATSAAHRRVDALFAPLDLGRAEDLGRFLAAHLAAYEALSVRALGRLARSAAISRCFATSCGAT